MRLRAEGELLVAGVRCTDCQRWYAVAEGTVIPFHCWYGDTPAGLRLEHRPASALKGEPDGILGPHENPSAA